ncbi:MAG TPA: SIMPL domain-containing protein [Candidatus Acidoferrales bacterium]|nr:SIMPL domain-containing protein [Candidatus Acidoferrales bacterium]
MMVRTLALLAALFLLSSAAAPAQTVTRISVTGQGSVSVTPDQALIRASIETNADRAAEAISKANTIYARAVDAVTGHGVARTDVTLDSYTFDYNPRPSPQPGQIAPSGRYGYIVARTFDVKVRNVNDAGPVVDALTGAGITTIGNVVFSSSNTTRARSEATARAMADARAKAEDLAKAAGLHIIGIEQINYQSYVQPPVPMMRMSLEAPMGMAVPTVLDSGGINVTESVNTTFLAAP